VSAKKKYPYTSMLTAEKLADDAENMMSESNGLLETGKTDQPEIPFCGCMSVKYYQPVSIL
jgi:hypothetical protein